MTRRLVTGLLVSLVTLGANAQWTAKDSLNLKRVLQGGEELKLNREAVKQIDLGKMMGAPRQSKEKNWLLPDESLPAVLPDKKKVVLTLYPYKANTRFDWDPVYQKKIKVDKDTWRGDPLYGMKGLLNFSNWAKTPISPGIRKSLDEIRYSGVEFRQMGERLNNMLVNRAVISPTAGIPLGGGVTVSGVTLGGLNLMGIFQKDFWDKKGNDRRARTLEVLKAYGDSTTVNVPDPTVR